MPRHDSPNFTCTLAVAVTAADRLTSLDGIDTTKYASGTLAYALDTGRVYYLDKASAEGAVVPTIVAPLTGTGRWKSIELGASFGGGGTQFMFGATGMTNGATTFLNPFDTGNGGAVSAEAHGQIPSPVSGVIKGAYFYGLGTETEVDNAVWTLRKNGADTTVSLTLAINTLHVATAFVNPGDQTVAAGDLLSVSCVRAGGANPASMWGRVNFVLAPTA